MSDMRQDRRAAQADKARVLLRLHTRPEILELRNVWDVTSTQAIAARSDTTAIATASAAVATSHGYDDGEHIPWPLHLACIQRICAATDLPVTVDIERGYRHPDATVRDVIQAGVAGINLEDALSPPGDFARILTEVRAAADALSVPLVINARTDEFRISPTPSLANVIDRAHAYLEAGADCVFVPGLIEPGSIQTLVNQIGRQRISLLALPGLPTAHELERLGIARVSHGPALHRAVQTFMSTWQ